MKIKTFLAASAVFALSFTLALVSCFSPWEGDEATLTISVGGGSSRVLVNRDDNEQAGFSYEVNMTGPGGKLSFEFEPGAPLTVKVIPGKWQVEVRAMGTSDLRAFGEWEGVVGGNTSADITMYSASEVSNWDQLEAATSGDSGSDRKEIIFLKSGEWTITSTIEIKRPIELRAVETVAITGGYDDYGNATGYAEAFFIVSMNLILKGPLTLDGILYGRGPGDPIISVIGKLEMYDGVILQNNDHGTFGGGGVQVKGGTFNMYGGTIKNNIGGGIGGGVYVEGGTFNMYGGTIKNNNGDGSGGGVYVISGGTFTMTGGRIYGNTAGSGREVFGENASNIIIFGTHYSDGIEINNPIP